VQALLDRGLNIGVEPDGSDLTAVYTIVNRSGGEALISGHPSYCSEPVPVRIAGSTWGGSMLKLRFIGRGMHVEFYHPTYHTITTSRIVDIRTSA
jgi:hypothetical protein